VTINGVGYGVGDKMICVIATSNPEDFTNFTHYPMSGGVDAATATSESGTVYRQVINGVFAATAGDFQVPHNLPSTARVRGLDMGAHYQGTTDYLPMNTELSGYAFSAYTASGDLVVRWNASEVGIQGKPWTATITYIL
jgi:hypothetical protein